MSIVSKHDTVGRRYFPLHKRDPSKTKLLRAAKLIDEVITKPDEKVYSGSKGQFGATASDGQSLGMLELAARLLRDEVI